MKLLIIIKMMMANIILAVAAWVNAHRGYRLVANTYDAAVMTHDTTVRRTNDSAITARHLLWAPSGAGTVDLADGSTPALGTIDNTETETDMGQTVLLLGKGSTKKMVASEAIGVGAAVYQAASGKVATTGSILVGYAMTAAGANNDVLEVHDVPTAAVLPTATVMTATAVAADTLAIPLTHRSVNKTTGADAEALTLADGLFLGQRLNINLVADGGGDGTLTPTTASGFTAIVFADAGDFAELEWTTAGWRLIGVGGATAQPAVTL